MSPAQPVAPRPPVCELPLTAVPPAAAPPGTPTTHVGKYTLYETIGEGAFGKVKIGVNKETGKHVAVKIMDKKEIREQDLSAQVRREIYIMRSLTHKHIVRMNEVLTSTTKLYIVMELVTGGELFDRLYKHGRVDEALARRYFQQLVDGVDFCHKSGVAHRDLKPENLLLDEEGNIKLTDFGFSSMKSVFSTSASAFLGARPSPGANVHYLQSTDSALGFIHLLFVHLRFRCRCQFRTAFYSVRYAGLLRTGNYRMRRGRL